MSRRRGGRVPHYHKSPDWFAGLSKPSQYIQIGAQHGPEAVLAAAVGDIGHGLIQQYQQEKKTAVAAHFARSKFSVDSALQKAALTHERDAEMFNESVSRLRSKWLEELPNDYRNEAALYFDTEAHTHALKITKAQHQQQREENKAVLLEAVHTAHDRASTAIRNGDLDAARRETIVSEGFRHQLFNSDLITAEDFVRMGDTAAFSLTRNHVLGEYDRRMSKSPAEAQTFINDLRQNENIAVEDRDKLTDELQKNFDAQISDHVRLADRAERQAEKELKGRQQEVFADALSRLNDDDPSNDLTQIQLDELLVQRDLDHTLHSKLSKALLNSGEAVKDDMQAVVQLYQDLESQTDPGAFKTKALDMYTRGLLTKATLDKFRTQVDLSDSERPEVRQYRSFVADAIATAGPLAVLDQDTSFRKASAIREYNERVSDGEDPRSVADDVVNRYRLSAPGPTGLPKPRFLEGGRSDPEALEAARRKTAQAFQSGEMTEDQALEEAQLIKTLLDMARLQEQQRLTYAEKTR